MEVKDNEVKNNTVNFALVNNTAQINTEINNNIEVMEKFNLKTYIEALFYTDKKLKKIEHYQIKKAEAEQTIIKEINKIKSENINKNPRLSIIGPAFEQLKYNIEEEQFVELFSNIIAGEFNTQKCNKILPSYINIITQLSKDDATFLKKLSSLNCTDLSLINIRLKNQKGFVPIDDVIIINKNNCRESFIPQKIVLENLERLNIIKIDEINHIVKDIDACQQEFELYKSNHIEIIKAEPNETSTPEFSYNQEILKITNFGKNFIYICCSEYIQKSTKD